jgi:hypothetical protein
MDLANLNLPKGVFVVAPNEIVKATVSLWERGELSDAQMQRCVEHWFRNGMLTSELASQITQKLEEKTVNARWQAENR